MNLDENDFIYKNCLCHTIETKLINDGYVRIKFCEDDLSNECIQNKVIESFFLDFIKKLGGNYFTHHIDENSVVWHLRIASSTIQYEKDQEFPFRTDCCYESDPPEYLALFILEQDKFGGGQFEIIRLADIVNQLSEQSKKIISEENFKITIPVEFQKSNEVDHIYKPILHNLHHIRYDPDLLFIDKKTSNAFHELQTSIRGAFKYIPKLEKYTMIIVNNTKYLHRWTKIIDEHYHVLQIRFNRPNSSNIVSIPEKNHLRSEYLTLSHNVLDYLREQNKFLSKALQLIVQQYHQPTEVGAEIRRTFKFESKIHKLLCDLNIHRFEFDIENYQANILFTKGFHFMINGKHRFDLKICDISTEFAWNAILTASGICSGDVDNQISVNFENMLDTIVASSLFNTSKPLTILESRERSSDTHLFQKYWINKYHQNCRVIHPEQIHVIDGQLFDQDDDEHPIEQLILLLNPNDILHLADDILHNFIYNTQLRYRNDFRTIVLLHDKRIFSLLSNEAFLDALWQSDYNQTKSLSRLIPMTYVIGQMPPYVRECTLAKRNDWCIKPNLKNHEKSISIGEKLSDEDWRRLLCDLNTQQWIIQRYYESIQYDNMNLAGTLFCGNINCVNLGPIRLSQKTIVNNSNDTYFIRPFIHCRYVHRLEQDDILTKIELHKQLELARMTNQHWNRNVYFSSSGGSGGKRLFFATDIQENQRQREILVDMMLLKNVLSETDICLNLFQSNNLYRSLEIFNDFCSLAYATVLPMGSLADDDKVLQIIEHFQPNVLMGSPYRLMQLALFIEKHYPENSKFHFEKIFFACEPLDNSKRDYFQRIFHCSTCLGFYGSAEVGVFACQTPDYCNTQLYQYPKELVQVDIFNEQIIVTNLIRRRNQLIRFNTGDLGQLIPTDDNEPYGLIEVWQSQRLIYFAPGSIKKSDIEDCMKEYDLIEWQLVLENESHNNNRILLTFRCVEKTNISIVEQMKINIKIYLAKCLARSFPIEDRLTLRFDSVQYEELIRDSISNKLLKIIDRQS